MKSAEELNPSDAAAGARDVPESEMSQSQQNESVCLEDTQRHLTNYTEDNLLKQSHYSASAPLPSPPPPTPGAQTWQPEGNSLLW